MVINIVIKKTILFLKLPVWVVYKAGGHST